MAFRTPNRASRRRVVAVVGLMVLLGSGIAAGCESLASAAPSNLPAGLTGSTTPSKTTTATTELPQCGASRDPLDPSGSPPPAGSPAIC